MENIDLNEFEAFKLFNVNNKIVHVPITSAITSPIWNLRDRARL